MIGEGTRSTGTGTTSGRSGISRPHGQQHVAGGACSRTCSSSRSPGSRPPGSTGWGPADSTWMPRPSRTAAKWSSCSFAPLHRLERPRTPLPAHGAVLRDLGFSGRLGRGDAGVVGPAEDYVAQGNSKSFHELTMVRLIASLLSRGSADTAARPVVCSAGTARACRASRKGRWLPWAHDCLATGGRTEASTGAVDIRQ